MRNRWQWGCFGIKETNITVKRLQLKVTHASPVQQNHPTSQRHKCKALIRNFLTATSTHCTIYVYDSLPSPKLGKASSSLIPHLIKLLNRLLHTYKMSLNHGISNWIGTKMSYTPAGCHHVASRASRPEQPLRQILHRRPLWNRMLSSSRRLMAG
jgi:hypothetical protein